MVADHHRILLLRNLYSGLKRLLPHIFLHWRTFYRRTQVKNPEVLSCLGVLQTTLNVSSAQCLACSGALYRGGGGGGVGCRVHVEPRYLVRLLTKAAKFHIPVNWYKTCLGKTRHRRVHRIATASCCVGQKPISITSTTSRR